MPSKNRQKSCKRQRTLGADLGFKTNSAKRSRGSSAQGGSRRRSDYGVQLVEKQKLRDMYGVSEKQFRNLYKYAKNASGDTAEQMLQLLESRLDNVVYNLGFASTRSEARQMISHGHIEVQKIIPGADAKDKPVMEKVTIKSYRVAPGQKVAVKSAAQKHLRIKAALEFAASRSECEWFERADFAGLLKALPTLDQMPAASRDAVYKVIEFYSR